VPPTRVFEKGDLVVIGQASFIASTPLADLLQR